MRAFINDADMLGMTAIQINQAVVAEATKGSLRISAIHDITSRARNTFRLVNGVPQAFEADGQTARVDKDGMTPLSLAEWIDLQVSEAPHLFDSNAGGGAAGHGSGGAGGGNRFARNPFRKESWNLTEHMKLQKSDPALAARLRRETTLPLKRIAARVGLGTSKSANRNLYPW